MTKKTTGRAFAVAAIVLACVSTLTAQAKDLPRRSAQDDRIGYVTYDPSNVVEIPVAVGVVTRVILHADEKIKTVGAGFASQCRSETNLWCIEAEAGSNQIWVKPLPGATFNNIEVSTDQRDYSIRFVLSPGAGKFRVHFQYPVAAPQPLEFIENPVTAAPDSLGKSAMRHFGAQMRNINYLMEAGAPGALAIAPNLAFDDGRFTYLVYPKGSEIPAPFVIGPDGQEARVNFHFDNDRLVLQRVAPEFVLRLGGVAVRLVNKSYEPEGIATPFGTTDGTKRELKNASE